MSSNRLPAPREDADQIALVQWARLQEGAHPELHWFYHIENEGKRTPAQGARAKALGLKAGVADFCLPCARGGFHALYIELKREAGGRVSAEQRRFLADMRAENNCAVVCRGFDAAREEILAYLRGERMP